MPQKTSFGNIGPSGAPAGGALKNKSGPLGGSVDPEGGKTVAKGGSFAYRPEWEIFIKSIGIPESPDLGATGPLKQANRYAEGNGDLWRVSNALAGQASLTRQEDAEATLSFTLNNTGYVFSDVFEEMDMVACFLKGIVGGWKQVFTGYIQDIVDNDPMLQGGTLQFSCYDVCKRLRIYTISPGDEGLFRKVTAFERVEEYLKYFAKKAGFRLDQEVDIEPMEAAESFVGRYNANLTPEAADGTTDYASQTAKNVVDWIQHPRTGMVADFEAAIKEANGKDLSTVDWFWPTFQAYWATREKYARGHDSQWIADHMPTSSADVLGNELGVHLGADTRIEIGQTEIPGTFISWPTGPGNPGEPNAYVDIGFKSKYHDLFNIEADFDKKDLQAQKLGMEIKNGLVSVGGINFESGDFKALSQFIDEMIINGIPGLDLSTKIAEQINLQGETSYFRSDFVYPIRKVTAVGGKDVGDPENTAEHFGSLDDMTLDEGEKQVTFYPTKKDTEAMDSGDVAYINQRIDEALAYGVSWVKAMQMALGPDTVDFAVTEAASTPGSEQQQEAEALAQQLGQSQAEMLDEYYEKTPDAGRKYLEKQVANNVLVTARKALTAPSEVLALGWRAVACCNGKIAAVNISRQEKGIGTRVILEGDAYDSAGDDGEAAQRARASQTWVNSNDEVSVRWERKYPDQPDSAQNRQTITREDYINRALEQWRKNEGRDTQDGQLPADASDATANRSAPSGRDAETNASAEGSKQFPRAYFFYDHLSNGKDGSLAPPVKVGDKVKAGQVIGFISNTGCDAPACRLTFSFSPYGVTGRFQDPGPLLSMSQVAGSMGTGEASSYSDMEYSPYIFADEWISRMEARKFSENLRLPFYDESPIIEEFKSVAQYGNYHWWADGKGKLIVRHPRYFNAPKKFIPKEFTISGTLTKSDQDMATHVYVRGDVDWDWEVSEAMFTPDVMEVGKCTVEDNTATVFAWNKGQTAHQICNKFGVRKVDEADKYLHNRQQCTRYAMYKFAEFNRTRYTAAVATILDPTHEIMDQVYVETKNMMFTVTEISHAFGPDAQATTQLRCVAGTKPGEFGMLRSWLASIMSTQVGSAQLELDLAAKRMSELTAANTIVIDPKALK